MAESGIINFQFQDSINNTVTMISDYTNNGNLGQITLILNNPPVLALKTSNEDVTKKLYDTDKILRLKLNTLKDTLVLLLSTFNEVSKNSITSTFDNEKNIFLKNLDEINSLLNSTTIKFNLLFSKFKDLKNTPPSYQTTEFPKEVFLEVSNINQNLNEILILTENILSNSQLITSSLLIINQKFIQESTNNFSKNIKEQRIELLNEFQLKISDIYLNKIEAEKNTLLKDFRTEISDNYIKNVKEQKIELLKEFQREIGNIFSKRVTEEGNLLLNDFKIEVSNIIKNTKFEQKTLTSEFNELKNSFENLKKDSNYTDSRIADLKIKIDQYENEIEKLSKMEFEKIKIQIDNIAITAYQDSKKNLENNTNKIEIEFGEFKESFENMQTEINEEFAQAKKANESFVQLVENAGIYKLTENYNKKAEEEKTEYKNFRKYTTWAILSAVFFTLVVFLFAIYEKSGSDQAPDYLILISRLSISLMFFILALYLSKQAGKHYESYQENHRTFLQLSALEPFMARMTPEEQKEIRKSLIPSYFNQNVDGKYAAKGDEVDLPTNLNALVNRAFDVISEKKEQNNKSTPE